MNARCSWVALAWLTGSVMAQQPTAAGIDATSAPAPASAGDPDWAKEVARACASPRFGLRLAASKKVAAAGDAAIPAIRAYADSHGKNELPVALVDALVDGGGNGEAVLGWLEQCAGDATFFWRAQALKGLALRSGEPAIGARFGGLFAGGRADPAWMFRSYARFGSWLVSAPPNGPTCTLDPATTDADPRAATRFAALAIGRTHRDPTWAAVLPVHLLTALGDERTFLGDPWGRRRAAEALRALERWAGDDCGYRPDASFDDNAAAIAALAERVRRRIGRDEIPTVARLSDPDLPFVGGIEVLSCRHGDLFVRWTADGRVAGGPTPVLPPPRPLAAARWQQLSAAAAALDLPPQSGVVICDRMRIQFGSDRAQAAVAPAALPAAAADWLKQFAAAIEEAGDSELATALRRRLDQFHVR